MFDDILNEELKLNMSYGDKITSNGSLSVLAKLDMRSCHDDGFQYFVKESDFNNFKSYFEKLISSGEFGTKIDNIKFPYTGSFRPTRKL